MMMKCEQEWYACAVCHMTDSSKVSALLACTWSTGSSDRLHLSYEQASTTEGFTKQPVLKTLLSIRNYPLLKWQT